MWMEFLQPKCNLFLRYLEFVIGTCCNEKHLHHKIQKNLIEGSIPQALNMRQSIQEWTK